MIGKKGAILQDNSVIRDRYDFKIKLLGEMPRCGNKRVFH
jgi:hypothetical protein